MLYYLYSLFDINLFQYISVRAGFSFFIALIITLFALPRFITWAQKRSAHQPINEDAPQSHQAKVSTPTMGGIIFIGATVIASLLSMKIFDLFGLIGLFILITFSWIGFKDDIAKIRKNENSAGLSAKEKLFFQILFSALAMISLCLFAEFNTELYLPFVKNPIVDMGYISMIFWVFILVATSNAVNLTDGLDGLATVPSLFSLTTLIALVYITGHAGMSAYLLMPNFAVGEVVIIAAALSGALVGFLWFNSHPAEIFMGDSGSLPIGGFIAYMSIISKSEILLILIGLIFVIETVSVILQVGSYKLRKKRVFLMAPIHHHFEMKNWAENKIIVRFWIIAMLSNILALISLKIR